MTPAKFRITAIEAALVLVRISALVERQAVNRQRFGGRS